MGVALYVIIFTASGILCHQLAVRWGMTPVLWGVLGFCFGPFAVPFVLIFRPKQEVERTAGDNDVDDKK
ncbi:hypothetical protein ACFL2V_08580 [Pseudomonadota bacterium]